MPYIPRVGRHVAYLVQKTVDGNPNYQKRRPGTITAVVGGPFTIADLRVLRIETHSNVPKREHPDDNNTLSVYVQY